MMRRLVSCAVCVFLGWQLGSVWAAEPQDQVQIQVLFRPEECSRKSKKGDLINAHYDGFLEKDGSQFYCSRSDKQGHPQWFVLGVGQVIRGLDVGMMDMCAGEKRKVTVPSELAFGPTGKGFLQSDLKRLRLKRFWFVCPAEKGPVPPNATVVFEVEVLSVSRGPRSMEAFGQIDMDKDKSLTKAEVKEYLKLEYEKGGKPRDEPFYEKILADIFWKSDQDRDGQISAKEYNIYERDEL